MNNENTYKLDKHLRRSLATRLDVSESEIPLVAKDTPDPRPRRSLKDLHENKKVASSALEFEPSKKEKRIQPRTKVWLANEAKRSVPAKTAELMPEDWALINSLRQLPEETWQDVLPEIKKLITAKSAYIHTLRSVPHSKIDLAHRYLAAFKKALLGGTDKEEKKKKKKNDNPLVAREK